MSIRLKIKDLNNKILSKFEKYLTLTLEKKNGIKSVKKEIQLYKLSIDNQYLYIPFSFATKYGYIPKNRKEYKDLCRSFAKDITLREYQKEVQTESIKLLNKNKSLILALRVAFGKTILAISLICKCRLRSLIVVNKVILAKQWIESIKKFVGSEGICFIDNVKKYQKMGDLPDADFYIINAQNIEKFGHDYFNSIGMLVVDEVHCIMAEKLSKLMNYIQPRYLLGLSATPWRKDELNELFNLYFGDSKIVRKLYVPHIVYKIETNIEPVYKKQRFTGKVDWNSVIESLSNSEDRNDIILNIVRKEIKKNRNILIIVKRIEQGQYLYKKLTSEYGEHDVTTLLGKTQTFNKESKILIGTSQKVGTGFDHPKLNCLILGCPILAYFIQYLGRIFRKQHVEPPVIYDLVDNNKICEIHWFQRIKVYKNSGMITYKQFKC